MSSGFSLIKNIVEVQYQTVRISSQAYTLGDAVYLKRNADNVDVLPVSVGNGTPNSIYGVAMQTVTSAATTLLIALIDPLQIWQATTTNNSNAAHNYLRCIIGASAQIVNNTGSDVTGSTGIFQQIGVVGAVGDKRIVGNFLPVAGVSI